MDWRVISFATVFILAMLSVVFLTACERREENNQPCIFAEGDFVQSVLRDNLIGQVVWVGSRSPFDCKVDVRWYFSQTVDSYNFIGSGGSETAQPLAVIGYMKEYELKHYEK